MPSLCFPPRGCVFSHGMHGTHRSLGCVYCPQNTLRRVWHPAIPTPPSANPPTEFTEFTEISGVEEPPTDFTDAHRWLGCVRFCGFCGKIVWCMRGYGRDAIPSYNCTDWGLKFCVFCAIRGRISQQEVSVGSANSVGGRSAAWLVQWRPLHPLVECKKCIDFFVVTKFRCIFAM